MQKRLLLNFLKIVGLLSLSLEWHPGQNSSANSVSRSPDAATPNPSPSFNLAQLEELTNNLPKVGKFATDNAFKHEQLCDDRSDAYLKLPLQEVDPTFRVCASELLKRTQVPIVLPPIPPTKLSGEKLYTYLYIPPTNANQYSIQLTLLPRRYYPSVKAYFEGEKLSEQSPTLSEAYEKAADWRLTSPFFSKYNPGLVQLSQETEGYYIPSICSANCKSAYDTVIWD
ncbi:MAG TPA: hypothetical protein V6D18_10150 [Thermosynechococcaceae cyanobacterium]